MTDEKKLQLMQQLAQGGMQVGQLIVENSGTITYNDHRGETATATADMAGRVDYEMVGRALQTCKDYIWGQAALATIFCVCRDVYQMGDNASFFERQMVLLNQDCPPGTISNAMRNNPYMRLHIDKWKAQGAQERVLVLKNEFQNRVKELLSEGNFDIPTT